jgi:exopolyphosphatase/guanosine-5'-triphosphate,3'-diphosphate pyrophosphatase
LNDKKIAVLDLGTNTFNLLIRDLDKQVTLSNTKIAVKLGKGGLSQNIIAPDAFERGLAAIAAHVATAKNFGVKKLFAFATSAIRSTTNGLEFSAAVAAQSGVQINIIDGKKEAAFIYEGVATSGALTGTSNALIMDIGGGSTEFILVADNQPIWFESYPLGASRIMENIQPSDPVSLVDIQKIETLLEAQLPALLQQLKNQPPLALIGSSGSFDTLYDLIAAKQNQPLLTTETTVTFDLEALRSLSEELLTSDIHYRLNMPGMVEMRADMIPISAIFIQWLLRQHHFKNLHLSTYALKEGVFSSLQKDPDLWQVSLL